ncbi:MAG: HD domain-containing protein [Anaerolineae bacterium]|nr:HD domain-containing protein [Anaerolineae bacterium]
MTGQSGLIRARKRFMQGVRAIFAFVLPVDHQAAADVLSPELFDLFCRMRRSEQIHSLRMMKALRGAGHDHPDLLTAALLHDVGKSRCRLTLIDRVMIVLAKYGAPKVFAQWSAGDPVGARRRYVIGARHAEWSAEDMLAAGASELAAALARRHMDRIGAAASEEDRLLALLMQADDEH